MHENMAKAESALAVQIRSEKIGFAKFLHTRRVPGVTSPAITAEQENSRMMLLLM